MDKVFNPTSAALAIKGIRQEVICPGEGESLWCCDECEFIPGYVCMLGPSWLFDIVMHLNDDHRWSRERIADWIETLDEIPGWA